MVSSKKKTRITNEKKSSNHSDNTIKTPSSALMRKLFPPQQTNVVPEKQRQLRPTHPRRGLKACEDNNTSEVSVVHSMKDWLQQDNTCDQKQSNSINKQLKKSLPLPSGQLHRSKQELKKEEITSSINQNSKDGELLREWSALSVVNEWVDSKLSESYLNKEQTSQKSSYNPFGLLSNGKKKSQEDPQQYSKQVKCPSSDKANTNSTLQDAHKHTLRKHNMEKDKQQLNSSDNNNLEEKSDDEEKLYSSDPQVKSTKIRTGSKEYNKYIHRAEKTRNSTIIRSPNSMLDRISLPSDVQAAIDLLRIEVISKDELEQVILDDLRLRRGYDNQAAEELQHILNQADALYKNQLVSMNEYLDLVVGHYKYHTIHQKKLPYDNIQMLQQKILELSLNFANVKANQEEMSFELQQLQQKFVQMEKYIEKQKGSPKQKKSISFLAQLYKQSPKFVNK